MLTKPLHSGSILKFATWNCGGLSFTQKELCRELNYDILSLTETHNRGKLKGNKNFLVSDPAPENDSHSGVGLLLSDRISKCVSYHGSSGSRIVYARINAEPCNLFVVGVYMPHIYRTESPYFNDTLDNLDRVLQKVTRHDCILVMGDLNCKLGRNIENCTGRWGVHKHSNKAGEDMLNLMRTHNLCATSTSFQPPRRKSNATFIPRDKNYTLTQIDYVLISSRWATSVQDCKVCWGISLQRWGRRYDHGLIRCKVKLRLSKSKPVKQLDYSVLRTNEDTRSKYNEMVKSKLLKHNCAAQSKPGDAFEHFRLAVTEAANETLPTRIPTTSLPKRHVSDNTRALYDSRQKNYENMSKEELVTARRNIYKSGREDYRTYVDSILQEIEKADRTGNSRAVTKLTKLLSKQHNSTVMPSKNHSGELITSTDELLSCWNEFLSKKFASPVSDLDRDIEQTVSNEDSLTDKELDDALDGMKSGKAPGWDDMPAELYQSSPSARAELYRIIRLIYDTELVPEEMVRGIFIMLYKKKDHNCYSNYRAICLLCHAYKLLSAVTASRLYAEIEHVLPDSQAGFRPARGTRDNICILKWTVEMLLREGREAVITFIDYSAAFDTESQKFLDEALGVAGVSTKIRRVIQAIFRVAHGCVRIRRNDGTFAHSEQFDISRGVLQGDIFSPVAFIAGLWRIFSKYDIPGAGVTVGQSPYDVLVSKLEYADDAGMIDENTEVASVRLTAISDGSKADAAMDVSLEKTKGLHVHKREKVSETSEAEVEAQKFKHKCPVCSRTFPTLRGQKIHSARWCDGGETARSRKGSLADKAVQLSKRKVLEAERSHVSVNGTEIENVDSFIYLGAKQPGDGDEEADVKHRMEIAQAVFNGLYHLWKDMRLPLSMKLRLYIACVCSSFTHGCEAWTLTDTVRRKINGFNSRCLHVLTGEHYRDTATKPVINLLLQIRRRRMRYLGHLLRMPPDRLVRRAFFAYIDGGRHIPDGSLFMDCINEPLETIIESASDRKTWNDRVMNLK